LRRVVGFEVKIVRVVSGCRADRCAHTRRLAAIIAFTCIALNVAPVANAAEIPPIVAPPNAFPPPAYNEVGGKSVVYQEDGSPLLVTGIELVYHTPGGSAGLPDLREVMSSVVVLGAAPNGWVAPMIPPKYETARKPLEVKAIRLSEIGSGRYRYLYASGIQEVSDAIYQYFNRQNIMGVFVRPSARDLTIGANQQVIEDKRPAQNRTTLRMEVYIGRVDQVRTIASGQRIAVADRVNNPRHQWIKDGSPVQPATTQKISPLRKDLLDAYVLWLNQHPGRHVDVSIASANRAEPELVTLDYLVAESKPWLVYGQISNTGTEQTSDWRERIGFTHNQLTDRDDILTADYMTAGFSDSHSLTLSYDSPLPSLQRVRGRVYGLYDEFQASDVGQSAQDFSGETAEVGAEMVFNIYQRRELFVYAVGGLKFDRMRVENETEGVEDGNGKADYLTPYIGLRLADIEETRATVGDLTLLYATTTCKTDNLEAMGRTEPDGSFFAMQGNISHAFFLEPLFRPEQFRRNEGVLAQEIALSLKGQYVFDDARVIPQWQQTAGGFYTVRGYPESATAGDTVICASAEYRFHVPRSFKVQPDPRQTKLFGRFRVAPQQPFGQPDWDLIPRAFIDVGRTINNDKFVFEEDQTLVGVGVGVEFQYKQNVNLRVDWGFALVDLDDPTVDDDKSRVHVSLTVLY
jgi:hemolysin activation/secretion protein